MRLTIRRLARLITLLLAAALVPATAQSMDEAADAEGAAGDIVFSAGREGGGYWGVAERMKAVAAESGLRVEVRESVGSMENLHRLEDPSDPVNLTLTQADAFKRFLQNEPGFANRVEILESIGLECIFIVTAQESGIRSDQDLQAEKGYRIAIPGEDSGVAVTFEYMSKLVPGLANTRPIYTDTLAAMRSLGGDGAPDAVMVVHRPKLQSPELQLALDAPDKYRLIPVEDRHLADTLPSGEAVYDFLDVPLIRTGLNVDRSLPTICTKGMLVASSRKMPADVRRRLKKVIDFQWMRIYPADGY